MLVTHLGKQRSPFSTSTVVFNGIDDKTVVHPLLFTNLGKVRAKHLLLSCVLTPLGKLRAIKAVNVKHAEAKLQSKKLN